MTLPWRAMRPEAPFSRPVVICSCITVLILFRRSREKPACSGAAVGKLAPTTNDATKQKTKRIRMSANLSQSHSRAGCGIIGRYPSLQTAVDWRGSILSKEAVRRREFNDPTDHKRQGVAFRRRSRHAVALVFARRTGADRKSTRL